MISNSLHELNNLYNWFLSSPEKIYGYSSILCDKDKFIQKCNPKIGYSYLPEYYDLLEKVKLNEDTLYKENLLNIIGNYKIKDVQITPFYLIGLLSPNLYPSDMIAEELSSFVLEQLVDETILDKIETNPNYLYKIIDTWFNNYKKEYQKILNTNFNLKILNLILNEIKYNSNGINTKDSNYVSILTELLSDFNIKEANQFYNTKLVEYLNRNDKIINKLKQYNLLQIKNNINQAQMLI
jgi:hypothetical protein